MSKTNKDLPPTAAGGKWRQGTGAWAVFETIRSFEHQTFTKDELMAKFLVFAKEHKIKVESPKSRVTPVLRETIGQLKLITYDIKTKKYTNIFPDTTTTPTETKTKTVTTATKTKTKTTPTEIKTPTTTEKTDTTETGITEAKTEKPTIQIPE